MKRKKPIGGAEKVRLKKTKEREEQGNDCAKMTSFFNKKNSNEQVINKVSILHF